MKDVAKDKTYDKQYDEAFSLLYGWHKVKPNIKKAESKLKSLYDAEKYPEDAMLQLYVGVALYDNNIKVKNSKTEAEKWFYSAIKNSNPKDRIREKVTLALKSAVEAEDASAQVEYLYAYCLLNKNTLDKTAGKYFLKAAEKDHASAQYMLALCYAYGACKCKKDPKKTFAWAQKASLNGEAQADLLIGTYYHEGLGVEKDDDKAIEYLQKAIENKVEGSSEYLEKSGLLTKLKEEKANNALYSKLLDENEALKKELAQKEAELKQKDQSEKNKKQNISEFEAAFERVFQKYSTQFEVKLSSISEKQDKLSEKQDELQKTQNQTLEEVKNTRKEVKESRKDIAELVNSVTVHFNELAGRIDNFYNCIAEIKTLVKSIFETNTKMYREASALRENFGTKVDELIKNQSDQADILSTILTMQRDLDAKVDEQLELAQKEIDKKYEQLPKDIKAVHEEELKAIFGEAWRSPQRLSKPACDRLVSARVLLHYSMVCELDDYRGVVISATSALEYELCRRFYDGYMSYLKKRLTNDKRIPIEKKYDRFTLGSLMYVLQEDNKTPTEIALMNEYLKKYIFSEKAEEIMRDKKYTYAGHVYIGAKGDNSSDIFIQKIRNIKCLYRDKAAHKDIINKSLAVDCCKAIGIGEARSAVSAVEGVLFDLLELTKKFNK